MTVIVVGVDGSAEGRAALAWAIEEAGLRQATIRAVHAWCIDDDELHPLTQLKPGEAAARARLRAELAAAGAHAVPVEEVVQLGDAADVLVAASRTADLVVVGSRGRGSFTALILGSVGASLIHHAVCPIVVVPRRKPDG